MPGRLGFACGSPADGPDGPATGMGDDAVVPADGCCPGSVAYAFMQKFPVPLLSRQKSIHPYPGPAKL